MASLKDVKMKIAGVGKTKQITKAMYMVSSAKLRGAQSRIERFRPYADKFHEMLTDLAGKAGSTAHPLLEVRDNPENVGIILNTSDRGLCGGFNINLISAALKLANRKAAEGKKVHFYCVGRKGRDAVRKSAHILEKELVGQMESLDFQVAASTGEDVLHDYLSGKLDEVYMIFAEFVSMGRQVPRVQEILPIRPPEQSEQAEESVQTEYLYEPSGEALLSELLPRYVKVQIYRGLLDTSASEHAARMAAMDNATRNSDDIIGALTLLYNKTRQASITTDLIDIVSGANALNG